MNKQLKNFMDFVRTHGVVGLAVGLAIGTQVGDTVKVIVDNFINPIVGFIVGSQDGLKAASWNIVGDEAGSLFTIGERSLVIGWGGILSSLITLLAVAGVIYYVIQGLKLDKLDKKKDDK